MIRTLRVVLLVAVATTAGVPATAQQAPMTAMEAPAEPDAIPLDTGGVEGADDLQLAQMVGDGCRDGHETASARRWNGKTARSAGSRSHSPPHMNRPR